MGSIGLLYATQTRAPHCSHSQLNDGVDGIGTWSTRGQASTSRNSKFDMYERYTRNLFGPCAKFAHLPMIGTTRSRVSHFMNKFREMGFIDYNGHLEVHNSLLGVLLADQPRTVSPPK
jgi:hypothetical protein